MQARKPARGCTTRALPASMERVCKLLPMLIAVDTNVLMRIADPDSDSARRARDILRRKLPGSKFGVPPTVVQELAHLEENGNAIQQMLAATALDTMLCEGFTPFDLISVGHGITETIVFKILAAGLLPEDERNDAFVIAESALAGFELLWSDDEHMLATADQDPDALPNLLKDQHTEPLRIISTRAVLRQAS
jgi:predicted nucleic acid-binding protein